MTEYIEKEKVLSMSYCANQPTWDNPHLEPKSVVDVIDIETLPAADVVSQAVFEQVKWERDTALATLEEHGIGFAQKADVVEVVHGEWLETKYPNIYQCSECYYEWYVTGMCRKTPIDNDAFYCPCCGADMRRIEKR